ncbi:HU family DNA-binding protein [Streptosporangium sp. NPDC002607]
MNKTQLIDATAEHAGVTKAQATQVLNALFDVIPMAVAAGDEVAILGFGTFAASGRAARTGRHPQTGEPLEIAASRAPKFRPGSAFKDLVNTSRALVSA